MLGKHKFRKGQRVWPSDAGIKAHFFIRKRHDVSGVVTRVDEFNCPTVRWDDRKGVISYHPDFIQPDHRRKRRAAASAPQEDADG